MRGLRGRVWPLWAWVGRGWVGQLSPSLAGTCVVGAPLRADHSSPITPVTCWGSRGAWENQNEISASPSLPFCGMELAPIQGAFWPFWGSPSIIPFLQVKRLCWHSLQSSELSFHTISLLQRVVFHFIVILVSLYCAWYIAFDIHRMGLWLFLYCIKTLPQGKLCPSVAVDWDNQNLTFGGSMDRQQAAYTSTVLWYRVGPKLLQNSILQFLNKWCDELRIQLVEGEADL